MSQTQFKTLRLFDGANTNEDWHPRSIGYTKDEIANIPDPAAGSRKEITSIPSPFARVHLFENAFLSVSNQANREGLRSLNDTTAYHQLVSDALDVAEIFFNFEVFNQTSNNLRFVVWKKETELARLKANPNHRLVGETLELFLDQDAAKTRFDLMDHFYLLFCNNVLVGGSSPSTLFFAAYNEGFRLADLGLGKGDDKFFDGKPCPLYLRSKPFQRYLYGLFKVEPSLKTIMAPMWKYLEVSQKALQQERRDDWQNLQDTLINNFDYARATFEQEFKPAVTTDENTFIDIIRDVHHRRLKSGSNDRSNDPFAIKSDKYTKGRRPLALQNHFAKALLYCEGRWKPDIAVPYYDPNDLEKRMPPAANEVYPYLTVSDFLEPQIMRVSYPIENDYFFDGNPEGFRASDRSQGTEGIPGEDSYLLPLTKRFFDFFGPEFLRQMTPDGRPHFRMIKTGTDSVEVQLLIPIQSGDFILFKRLYRPNQPADPVKNEGAVVACKFDLGFFPLFHYDKAVQQIIILSDGDVLPTTKNYEYNLEFYTENGQNVPPVHKRNRQDKNKHQAFISSKYFVQHAFYDFIQVSNGQHTGIIIPKWQEKPKGNKPVTVAIDFGTTNSFVSVALGDELPQPLEISFKDRFLVTLSESWVNTTPKLMKEVILRSLLPFTLGKEQECFLPMRTLISEIQGINHFQAIAGTDISIPFFFERRQLLLNEETVTNLKWLKLSENSGDANMVRVEAYLSMLLFLARNYAISKGGNLDDCNLVWLYPSSMGTRISILGRTWAKLAKQYLGDKVKVSSHSEAIAPFYAFGKDEEKSGDKPVLNVDIGGGTTDVIILHESRPVYSTSFRFAGNTIFGNGYGAGNLRSNGLVRLLKGDIDKWFDNNEGKIFNLNDAYRGESGISKMGSADINSLFFSIEGNREVAIAGIKPISYTDMLSDREDIKVAFLFFFSAVVYHLAHLMKQLDLPMPRQIAFSGKGAGIVSLLDAHPQRNAAGLAQLIFQKVYGVAAYHPEGLGILLGNSPKERTCYGAINLARQNMQITDPPSVVLLPENKLSTEGKTADGTTVRYKNITDDAISQIEKEVHTFLNFFFDLNQDYPFSKHFGALTGERLMRCKKVLADDLRNNIKVGLIERRKSADDDDPIAEPLFFYPLTGSIFQLLSHFADEAGKPKSV